MEDTLKPNNSLVGWLDDLHKYWRFRQFRDRKEGSLIVSMHSLVYREYRFILLLFYIEEANSHLFLQVCSLMSFVSSQD